MTLFHQAYTEPFPRTSKTTNVPFLEVSSNHSIQFKHLSMFVLLGLEFPPDLVSCKLYRTFVCIFRATGRFRLAVTLVVPEMPPDLISC